MGGQPAEKNEYSWLVALAFKFSDSPFCGGSLISSNTVLTAAHCEEAPAFFRVHIAEHDVTTNDGEMRIDVTQWISHPGYDAFSANSYDLDFAIVRLARDVTFSSTVSPICLPNPRQNYDQREAVVAGWGTLESGGSSPNVPHEVSLSTITNQQCITGTDYPPNLISVSMICAQGPGKDSCQGDSGGPLMAYEGGGRYFSVIGIVSWGFGCALPTAPGVYSRVTDQLQWIQRNMEGKTCPKPV